MLATFRKDFASHFATLATASALVMGLFGLLATQRLIKGDEVLPVFHSYVVWGLTPLAWLIVNRVFVGEYVGGGTGFLERLPLGRGRVFASKILLSLPLLAVLLFGGLSSILSAGAVIRQELPSDVAAAVFATSASYLGAIYAALVLCATLGRHRHFATVLVVGGLVLAWRSGVPLTDMGPLAYAGRDLLPPAQDEAIRWLPLAGTTIALAWVLTLLFGGRLVRGWQRPTNGRDVLAVTALSTVLGIALATTETLRLPFVLDGPVTQVESDDVLVTVRLRDLQTSQALAQDTAQHLADMRGHLGLQLPPVSIDILGVDSTGPERTFERAALDSRRGILVRTGPLPSEWDPTRFRAWILHHALDEATAGRLQRNRWRIILDGYPRWLALQGTPPKLAEQEDLRVASCVASLSDAGLWSGAVFLDQWEDTRRRVGDPLARSLARWVLEQLAQTSGPQAVHDLAREACASRAGTFGGLADGRDALAPVLHSSFRASLVERGVEAQRAHTSALDALPQLKETRLEVGASRGGAHPLDFAAGRADEVDRVARFALVHALSTAQTSGGLPREVYRDEAPLSSRPRSTTQRYPPGARVLLTFATYVPALGCDLVFGWHEVQVP